MPVYSYRCTECGHAFDIRQEFTDDSLAVCPECGGRLRKLYNSVGVTFSGSGFYRTDSRAGSGDAKPGESGSGDAKSGDSKPAEAKPAESKPAAASTPAPASAPAAKE
ncbi:MAG TPA: FmdB family zinc ribbon protein [Pseudolysinimonas sp.]|nr:FmdB family zinc ribbon protein [Pseudolysinimonas sp.]